MDQIKIASKKELQNIFSEYKFNRKLLKRWNEDMLPLLSEEIEFKLVMQTLATHFNLKVEKENQIEE